jgi:hypothetical protein
MERHLVGAQRAALAAAGLHPGDEARIGRFGIVDGTDWPATDLEALAGRGRCRRRQGEHAPAEEQKQLCAHENSSVSA